MIEVIGRVPKKIEGAVFDMDDTLLNNQLPGGINSHAVSRLEAIHQVGLSHGIDYLTQLTIEQSMQAFKDSKEHTIDGASWVVLGAAGIVSSADPIDRSHPLLMELAKRKHEVHRKFLMEESQPIPGAVDFIRAMYRQTNGQIALATGSIRAEADIFLKRSGLASYFEDRIVAFEDVSHPKPDPEPFTKALALLDIGSARRSSVVALEDDPLGVASAREAGLAVAAITSRHNREALRQDKNPPDVIFDDYAELSSWALQKTVSRLSMT